MQNLSLMGVMDCIRNRFHPLCGSSRGQRTFSNELGQTVTFDVFHHKEVLTFVLRDLVHCDDIGVS